MAMNADAVKTELRKYADPEFADYMGDPPDSASAASRAVDQWAEGLFAGLKTVIPASTTASAAQRAFQAAASGMHLDPTGAVFQNALRTFGETLCGGMAGYTVVAQPALFVPASPPAGGHAIVIGFLAASVVAYFSRWQVQNLTTLSVEQLS